MSFDILCCFYSEFNTEKGAEIIFQYPKDYIKQEDFLKISEFVITRTELCHNLVSLKLGNAFLMGFPIHLKNPIYDRAKFQFNFCLVISEEEYEKNFLIYELLLKKVATTFESIEIDAEYDFIKKNRNVISNFYEKLYTSLKNKEEVISIHLDLKNNTDKPQWQRFYFFFKFIDFSKAKTEILIYQVPVWLKYIDEKEILFFENNVKMIIEEIDGLAHVKKIANKLELDQNFVIYILYNLFLCDCITFVDNFQFTNIYRATNKLKDYCNKSFINEFKNFCDINLSLFRNKNKHRQILKVCNDEINDEINENNLIEIDNLDDGILFSLYCELVNSNDISEFLYKVKSFDLDIPLFVAFGIYKKILRRVHIYGYCTNKVFKENFEQGSTEYIIYLKFYFSLLNVFLSLLDGRHCLDEVCCETNKCLNEVLTLISNIKESTIIYK